MAASGGRPRRGGLAPWLWVGGSVLAAAAAAAAAGSCCALFYPVLEELRADRLRGENGVEERMLGFWSILVISAAAGCVSCLFTWCLTYLDSYQPGPLSLFDFRDSPSHGFNVSSGLAVLNGVLAMLTVIWSLS